MNNISRLLPNSLDLKLFNSLKDWLPDTIIDFHVHVHQGSGKSIFNESAMRPGQSFNWFDLELHKQVAKSFGLEKFDYRLVIFGLPFGDDERGNNLSLRRDFVNNMSLYPIDCLTDGESASDDFFSNLDARGIKTKIISKSEISGAEIVNNFSKKIWHELDDRKGFLVIHLPKNIFDNLDEIISLAKEYRGITFIIAHMGGFFLFDKKLPQALVKVLKVPNVYFDTAMVTDPKVISCAVSILGFERVIFGSDAPFGYMRGAFSKQDGQIRFYPDNHWSWDSDFFNRGVNAPHGMVVLSSILAIKQALDDCNDHNNFGKNLIFFGNAASILNGVKPSF